MRYWLEPKMDFALLAKIDTEIARPLLLVLASFILLDKLGNPERLSVMPLVTLFGTTLTTWQAVLSLLAVYLFAVGSLPVSFFSPHLLEGFYVLTRAVDEYSL